MATSTNEVVIRITGEDNASAILKKIGVALGDTGDEAGDAQRPMGVFAKSLKEARKEAKWVKEDLNNLKGSFKDLGGSFKNIGGSFKGFSVSSKGLGGSLKGIGGSFKGLGGAVKGVGGNMGKLVGSLGRVGAAAGPVGLAIGAVVAGLIKIGGPLLKAAVEMENLKSQLKAVQGSAEGAEKRFGELSEVSKEITGLDLNSLIKFDNVLQTVGLSGSQSETVLRGVAQAASEAGKTSAQTQGIMEQLSQAFSSNKIASEDLKTVWRELPKVQTVAKDLFGETAGTISGLRETFELLGIDARTGLTELFEGVQKVTEIDTNTFSTQWEMFQETMSQWAAALGGPIRDAGKELLKLLNAIAGAVEWTIGAIKNLFTDEETKRAAKRAAETAELAKEVQAKAYKKMKEDRDAYLESTKTKESQSFAERKEIANDYFDSQITYINSLPVKDAEKDKLLKANAESRKTVLGNLAKEEHEDKVEKLKNEVLEAQKAYDKIKTDGTASSTAIQTARQNLHDKQVELIQTEETDETKKYNAIKAAGQSYETEIKRVNKEVHEDKIEKLGTELTEAETYYGRLKTDANTSATDLKNAAKSVYDKKVELIEAELASGEGTPADRDAKLLKAAEEYKGEIERIDGEIWKEKKQKMTDEITAATTHYGELKTKGDTSATDLKNAAKSIYDKKVELIEAELANGEGTPADRDAKLLAAANTFKTEIDKIDKDIWKAKKQTMSDEITAATTHYGELKTKGDTSATDLKNAAKSIYDKKVELIEAELANGEGTPADRDAKLLKAAGEFKTEIDKIDKDIWKAKKQTLSDEITAATTHYGELKTKAGTSATDLKNAAKSIYDKKVELIEAELANGEGTPADRDAKLLAAAEEFKGEIERIDGEIWKDKKQKMTDEITAATTHYGELKTKAGTSATDLKNAAQAIYDKKVDLIEAELSNGEGTPADRDAKLLAAAEEFKGEIAQIDEDITKKKNDELNQQLINAENNLDAVYNYEDATADDINAAAKRVYDAKKALIELNITDEEERAFALEAIERELNEARTNSVKHFFAVNEQLIRNSVDMAIDAANTIIGIKQEEVNATRQIEIDYAKSKTDFQTDRATILAEYSGRMVAKRAEYQPQIQAALDAGDQTEANRLIAARDLEIGMTSNGQVLNDEYGNMIGLVKEQSDALQGITDTLNDAHKEYHGGLRDIQQQIDEQKSKGFWDTVGSIADFGLEKIGQAVGTFFGAPEVGQIAGDLLGDVAKAGTGWMGDRAVSGIRDKAAATELGFYRADAWAGTRARNQNILAQLLGEIDWDTPAGEKEKADDRVKDSDDKTTDRVRDNSRSARRTAERTADRSVEAKEEADEKITASDNKTTSTIIDNANTITTTRIDGASDEVDAMKKSYETQVQLNTDLQEQIAELLDAQVEDTENAGLNITHIVAAINHYKGQLAQDETDTTKNALDTQVRDTASAGLNITHIIQALNHQKMVLTGEEVETTKDALDTQVTDTATAGLNITHIIQALNHQKAVLAGNEVATTKGALDTQVGDTTKAAIDITDVVAAVNATKEALTKSEVDTTKEALTETEKVTKESGETVTEEYKTHTDGIKSLNLERAQHAVRLEGAIGVFTKARLDNTLEDYRDHFQKVKDLADDAYDHINRRQHNISRADYGRSSGGSRGSRTSQALAKKRQKPEQMIVEMYADYGDGHQKKMGQGIAQQKKDRRVTPNV